MQRMYRVTFCCAHDRTGEDMSHDFAMGLLCGALGLLVIFFVVGWEVIDKVFPDNDSDFDFLCEKCAKEVKIK